MQLLLLITLASFIGVARALPGAAGDAGVALAAVAGLSAVLFGMWRIGSGTPPDIGSIAAWGLLFPASIAAAKALAYPDGIGFAVIQFERAIEHLLAGQPMETARLTLYPTSLAGAGAVARLTGLDIASVLHWSWLASLPLMVVGFSLLVRALSGSVLLASVAVAVSVSNPFITMAPVYDGFNMTLMPFWGYLIVVTSNRKLGSKGVAAWLLILAAMITSHFFTAVFAIVLAVGIRTAVTRAPAIRALGAGVSAGLLPAAAMVAWLAYIAVQYMTEMTGLAAGFLASLFSVALEPAEVTGFTLLSSTQAVVLGAAIASYAVAGLVVLIMWLRRRGSRTTTLLLMAVFALPFVIWPLATPAVFAAGTDMTEWKVRPIYGVYLMAVPMLALGYWAAGRSAPRFFRGATMALLFIPVLVNAVTLPLSLGTGPRTFAASAPVVNVEDESLTPLEYRLLGDYVRAKMDSESVLIADFRQVSWIIGADGLSFVPLYQSEALASTDNLTEALENQGVDAIAADRNLVSFPSMFLQEKASPSAIALLDVLPLVRAYDSGLQSLHLRTERSLVEGGSE